MLHWLIGLVTALLVLWLALVAAFYLAGRRAGSDLPLRDALRLLPDVLRLVRRLSQDPTLPRSIRWRLLLLLAYLVSPIDLVPDVVPVAGYADDALVLAWVLRSVVRAAGPEALDRHWPGTPEGLGIVRRLAGLGEPG